MGGCQSTGERASDQHEPGADRPLREGRPDAEARSHRPSSKAKQDPHQPQAGMESELEKKKKGEKARKNGRTQKKDDRRAVRKRE